jgi:hypothetical protein
MIAGSSLGPEVDLAEMEQRLAVSVRRCMTGGPLSRGGVRSRGSAGSMRASLLPCRDALTGVGVPGIRGTVGGRCPLTVLITLGIQLRADFRVKG